MHEFEDLKERIMHEKLSHKFGKLEKKKYKSILINNFLITFSHISLITFT